MAVWDWVTTAADNDDADAAINWAEGQAPSTVNDSARSMMARISHWLNTLSGNVTMGGASNAYTLTTGESLSAYPSNFRVLWQPNADSTGAVTLNVDGIGAKKVYMPDGTQAGSGDLDADSMYDVAYDGSLDSASGGFKIIGFPDAATSGALIASNNLSDLASASTARSNLGLGTMAVEAAADYLTTASAASTYAALAGAAFTGGVTMAADLNVDSGALFVDVSTDRVGIGETSPQLTLHVKTADLSGASYRTGQVACFENSGNVEIQILSGSSSYGQLRFGDGDSNYRGALVYDHSSDEMRLVTAGATQATIDSSGNLDVEADVTAVDFNATSDERMKENFRPFNQGLEYVLATEIVRFNRIGQDGEHIGPLAQQMEIKFPEGVNTGTGEDGIKTVDLLNMIGAAYAAIQELNDKVEALENGRS